jgi:mRNA interferase MazF
MQRCEIYLADINPRSGSEQKGIRPVIIISHDSFNTTPNWNSIIVIPVSTSEKQIKRAPTVVKLSKNDTDLEKDSFALCHQITTLDKSKLKQKLGTLSENYIKEIEKAIKYSLSMFE